MKRIIFIGLILVVAVLTGLYATNRTQIKISPAEQKNSVNAG